MSPVAQRVITPGEPICVGPLCEPLKQQGAAPVFASTIGKLVNIFIIYGGLTLLAMLLWGAYDWIVAGDNKENLTKAQHRMYQALIGMIVLAIAGILWGFVIGDILGIIVKTDTGWILKIPSFLTP